jgi:hypothetical protein
MAAHDEGEEAEEAPPIVVVQVDDAVPDTARRDVEDPVRQVAAPETRHAADRIDASRCRSPLWTDRHALATSAMPQ